MAAKSPKKPDRMLENAVNGTGRSQLAAEMLPMRPGSSVGMAYNFPNPRGESAGYTTSSPGWGQPMAQPPASLFPPAPAAVPGPPPTTSALPPAAATQAPPAAAAYPTPEMIANATTTPSALFQPLPNPGANATTSPSALFQPLQPYSQLPGAHGQPPAPQSVFNPASMGQPPAPQGVVDLPALGQPPAPQGVVGQPPAPPQARPSSVRPSPVRHPPKSKTGKMTAAKGRFGR